MRPALKKALSLGLTFGIVFSLAGCDRLDPEEVQQSWHLPEPGFVADSDKGRVLYETHCARCHGQGEKGTDQGPPLVHKKYRASHKADLVFHWAIKEGAQQRHWQFGDMPPVQDVSPQEAGHIIAFIRSEQERVSIR